METATATTWKIDASHTEVQFKVKHLVFTTVTGTFREISGQLISPNADFDGAQASMDIQTASLQTGNADRDAHLRSDDFFNAEKYPVIRFSNGVLKKVNGSRYALTGEITIRETTKSITLDVEYYGTIKDPWGNSKAGFELTGHLNRKEFGLMWNAIAEAGALLVAEDVKIVINAQLAIG